MTSDALRLSESETDLSDFSLSTGASVSENAVCLQKGKKGLKPQGWWTWSTWCICRGAAAATVAANGGVSFGV